MNAQVITPWLIFLDIDGTLVDDSHQPRESVVAAVRGARALGHRVYLSTGRSRTGISDEIMSIGFDGVVSASGGFIESATGLTIAEVMSDTDVRALVDTFARFDMEYTLQTNDLSHASAGLAERMRPILEEQRRLADGGVSALAHIAQLEERFEYHGPPPALSVARASFVGESAESCRLFSDALDQRFLAVTGTIPYLGDRGGEVGLRRTNKGRALRIVAEQYGIPMARTMAVGDSGNDLEMIAAAGVGVAMGDAPQEVCEVADSVTGTVGEDGVWAAFVRYALVSGSISGARGARSLG